MLAHWKTSNVGDRSCKSDAIQTGQDRPRALGITGGNLKMSSQLTF